MANDIVARALAIKATEGLTTKADLVDGKIPLGQLPDSLDDVREVASYNDLPKKGKIGIIYVTLDSNQIYRWSGSQYILISSQDIPTKVSELENDAGYLSEIPSEYVTQTELEAYHDNSKQNIIEDLDSIRAGATAGSTAIQPAAIEDMLTKTEAASTYQTQGDYATNDSVDQKIADLIGGAPEALDTLKELGDALTAHEEEYDALLEVVDKKANAADLATVATTGSYNDLTDKPDLFDGSYNSLTDKPEIPSIEGLATENYVDEAVNSIVIPEVPTNVSAFTNDAEYITSTELAEKNYLTEHQSIKTLNGQTLVGTGDVAVVLSQSFPASLVTTGIDTETFCNNLRALNPTDGTAFAGNLRTNDLPYYTTSEGTQERLGGAEVHIEVINNSHSTVFNLELTSATSAPYKWFGIYWYSKVLESVSWTGWKVLTGVQKEELEEALEPYAKTVDIPTKVVTYITTAPTADNTNGLKIVVLSTEPTTKYNGYIYIITE